MHGEKYQVCWVEKSYGLSFVVDPLQPVVEIPPHQGVESLSSVLRRQHKWRM